MDEIIEQIAASLAESYTSNSIPTEKERQAAKNLIPALEDVALRAILQDRLSTVESAIQVNLEDL